MAMSEFSYQSADGTKIAAYRWEPESGEPRAAGWASTPGVTIT